MEETLLCENTANEKKTHHKNKTWENLTFAERSAFGVGVVKPGLHGVDV